VGDPIPTQGYSVRDMEKLAAIAQRAVEDLYYANAEVLDPRQTLAAPAGQREGR
jgi:hypothetical protein